MSKGSQHSMFLRNATLLLASTLTVMAGATIAPSMSGMEQHFAGAEHAQLWVQLILTVPGLVIAIAAPLAGWLLDRWRKKQLLVWAIGAYAVAGSAGYWLDHSLIALLASRILLGVAVAAVMVTCTTLVGDYFTGAERGQYMGLMAAFGAFGGVIFVALATWLANIDWQTPFLVYLLALVLLPAAICFIHEPNAPATTNAAKEQAQPPAQTLHRLQLSGFYILALVEIMALYLVPVHLPFYLPQLGVVEPAFAGIALTWLLLVMALVSLAYRVLQQAQSFALLHAAGFAVLALGCVYLGLAANRWQILLAVTVMGLGLGVVRPNVVMWLMASTAPQVRGRVMGGLTSSFFIGQFICPLVTLPLLQLWGYSTMFALMACALLTVAVLIAAMHFSGAGCNDRQAGSVASGVGN